MPGIEEYFVQSFEQALKGRNFDGRRVGAELKFPLVNEDGSAASLDMLRTLFRHLTERGWEPVVDALAGELVGAKKPGEMNHTVASCETGFAKTEFSLAHVADLHALKRSVDALLTGLREFSEIHNVRFLAYGIHPVTRPGKHLLIKRGRTSVWDRFASNRHIPEEDGVDMHLFTVNAASHVHVSVDMAEAVPAVNVLNGFSGAQIGLTAHSNVWRGELDPRYRCVSEVFWDWWLPESNRVGVPEKAFEGLSDYVDTVAGMAPVFVKRDGKPFCLDRYGSFQEYYHAENPCGTDGDGAAAPLSPECADIDIHNSCYWYNARISQYFTVENRANDQQPPEDLVAISALTLGLVSALPEASEEIAGHDWQMLRAARTAACGQGVGAAVNGLRVADLASRMLDLAKRGLSSRGLGEEVYLAPFEDRLARGECPADEVRRIFEQGGMPALLAARSL